MWQVRLLDKAAYQTAVDALDAFAQGDAHLLAPLVARCHAYLRSEEFARWHRRHLGLVDCFARHIDKAVAERDLKELCEYMIPLLAMPDFQNGLDSSPDDSPNLVDFGDDELYRALWRMAPWMHRLIIDRFETDRPRYEVGLSMILLRREDLVRLRDVLRQVEDPESSPVLGQIRDRLLDLFERSLADEGTAVVMSDVG